MTVPQGSAADYDRTEAESCLSIDALGLLLAATGPGAIKAITLVRDGGVRSCAAGGRQFLQEDSAAEGSRWAEAVSELIRARLVRCPCPGGTEYPVTPAGGDAAARLRLGRGAPTADTADLARRVRLSGRLARPPAALLARAAGAGSAGGIPEEVVNPALPPSPPATHTDRPRPGAAMRRSVLVVETEHAVRALLRIQLRLAGLTVIEAASGRAGVAAFAAHRATVTVVVSGELEPPMDGAALLDGVRAIDPGVPVVFFLGQSLPHDVMGRANVEVFLKPNGMWELCRAASRLAAGLDSVDGRETNRGTPT